MAPAGGRPPSLKRQYPHVEGVEDWRAQQTLRLLWDRVFDLEGRLQVAEATNAEAASEPGTGEGEGGGSGESVPGPEGPPGPQGPQGPAGPPGPGGSFSLVVRETPSGVINGLNAAFTLAQAPLVGSDQVFLNGLLQQAGGVDYTISGSVVTFLVPPVSGDRVLVTYQGA